MTLFLVITTCIKKNLVEWQRKKKTTKTELSRKHQAALPLNQIEELVKKSHLTLKIEEF